MFSMVKYKKSKGILVPLQLFSERGYLRDRVGELCYRHRVANSNTKEQFYLNLGLFFKRLYMVEGHQCPLLHYVRT